MRKLALAVLLAVICGSAIPMQEAAAKETTAVPFSGQWRGGAYSDDATNKFTHCVAEVTYQSGIMMLVGITRSFNWTLGFADQGWNLQPKQQIPVAVTFDGGAPWSGTATAYDAHAAFLPMAPNSSLVAAFRGAYVMKVFAAGRTFGFNLTGTSRLMVELAHCVQTQLALERGERPPTYVAEAPRPLNPPATPAPAASSNATLELAATRIASNLLLTANLPHARLLSPAESPVSLRGRGAAWTSDAGLGAVELVSAASSKDAQSVASALIANDGAACKGDFASGRSSELVDDKVVTKAFTGCKDSAGTHAFRYFVLKAATGDFIVYELSGATGASAPAADSPLRDDRFQAAAVRAAFSQ